MSRLGAVGHAREDGQRLALRSRKHDDLLVLRHSGEVSEIDNRSRGRGDVAVGDGHVHVRDHGPASRRDLSSVFHSRVHDLLHAGNERCERCNQHPALRVADGVVERVGHYFLGWRVAGDLGVG